jgi:hypothetical protein
MGIIFYWYMFVGLCCWAGLRVCLTVPVQPSSSASATHTHLYEYMYAQTLPMSTFEALNTQQI